MRCRTGSLSNGDRAAGKHQTAPFDNVPRTHQFWGGRVAEGLPLALLAAGMTVIETSVLIAGVTGAGEDNGAHWATPNALIGTVEYGIENERRRHSTSPRTQSRRGR